MGGSTQSREYQPEEFSCITNRKGELGAGGFGVVRLGFHGVLGPIALKCSPVAGGSLEKDRLVRNVKTEMELIQKANHAHILRVHGWTQWSGSIALVMEYMPGGNLKTLLSDKQSTIKTSLRLRFGFEIADAISFIHNLQDDKRMTHGDIKPENVLLTMDLHCKLADFGGAKLSDYAADDAKPSKAEKREITRVYAAPERLTREPVPPKRSQDTYSYGLILFMILTGKAPYDDYLSFSAYLKAIMRGQRPATIPIMKLKRSQQTSHDVTIIVFLESAMKRCWDHKPENRPDMLDVRDELHQLLGKTNNAEIARNVADELERLNINEPLQADYPCAALDNFDTESKRFSPSIERSPQAAPSPQRKRKRIVKLPLTDVFLPNDQVALPFSLRKAEGLLDKYQASLKARRYKEAKSSTTTIIYLIENHIDATADDLRLFGEKLQEKKLYLESIAIFDAAIALFEKLSKTEENMKKITLCVAGMRHTIKAMIDDDASMKVIVREYVIPLMREKLRHIEDTSLISKKFKCLQASWILKHIEHSEYRAGRWEEREKTLRIAVTRLKDVFGTDAIKHRVYGGLLNNLGHVCEHTLRFEEAASFYKQAIDAKRAATDFGDEEERKREIEVSEHNLKIVHERM